jgi:hypothetical protein
LGVWNQQTDINDQHIIAFAEALAMITILGELDLFDKGKVPKISSHV